MGIGESDLSDEFEFDGNTFIEGRFQLIDRIRSSQGDEIVIESYYITEKNTGREFVGIERIRNAQGDFSIPAILSRCAVMSIDEEAFLWSKNVTSLTIPASVTRIVSHALCDCPRIKAFSVADDNPKFKSVSGLLLTKDGKVLVRGVNGDVTIPNGVTRIGDYAFFDLSGLTSVTIPSSVTSIGYCAFNGCSSLTSVTIPSSVTSIGDSAFARCSGLTSVPIPSGVTTIGEGAFAGCYGLLDKKGFVIERDVLYSFCGGEESVTIPDGVKVIGASAFMACMVMKHGGPTRVTIHNGVIEIGEMAFFWCRNLTDVTIPRSVTSIGKLAFSTKALKSVYVSVGDIDRVKKLFLDSGHDIKDIEFVEPEDGGS